MTDFANAQVVILAGGLGTRLRPITERIPKPLVEVGGKPFLFWQLMDLKNQGLTKVLLLVAYRGHQIEEEFGDGSRFGLQISYSQEPEPLGTGGALQLAYPQLEETFFLLNGDSFLKTPLQKLWDHFSSSTDLALVATYDNSPATPVPNNLKVEGNRVCAYQKGGGIENGFNCVDAGIYVLKKSIFAPTDRPKFELEQVWPRLIQVRQMGSFAVKERFYDIGTPERLKEFEEKVCDYF